MRPKINLQSGYSIVLFLLIISLVGGDFFFNFQLFGIEVYAFRIVLFVGFVFLLLTKSLRLYDSNYSKIVFFTLVFWLLYGAFLLVWSPNLILGVQELYYLSIGCLTYVILFSIKQNLTNFYDSLERYWLIGFICLSSFLLVEFLTQSHFSGSHFDKLTNLGYFHPANETPVFTFGNPNHLAIYLCLTILLSIYFILKGYKFIVHALVILVSINFLLIEESRLGELFLLATALLLIVFYLFRFARKSIEYRFEWKTTIFVFLVATLNFTLIYVKFKEPKKLIDISITKKGFETSKDLASKKSLVVALDANAIKEFKGGSDDCFFLIDKPLKEKLLSGETAQVRIKNVSMTEFDASQLYAVKKYNIWLSVLLVACLILVVGLILSHSNFSVKSITSFVSAFGILILGVFAFHSFERANKEFNQSVLAELNTLPKDITEINTSSLDASTALALKDGLILEVGFYNEQKSSVHLESLTGDAIRKNLILNGLDYLKESKYMGIGPGAYVAYSQLKREKRPIGTVESAHNFVIEILSQYGILVAGLLFLLFGMTSFVLGKSFFTKQWSNEHTFAIMLLVCLFLLGNANSRFLSLPMNWVILSFIFIVTDELFARHQKVESA